MTGAPTTADVRQWARDEGLSVPERGVLSPRVWHQYEEAHGLAAAAAGLADDGGAADGGDLDAGEVVPGPDPLEERAPRLPKRQAKGWRGRLWDSGPRKGRGKGGRGPRRPRVPVDGLISRAWDILANVAKPIPPTSRLLRLQAPVAGLVLEETVKNSLIDKALQPFARAEASGKAGFALFIPPLVTTAIYINPGVAPVALPVLREALLIWLEVAGPKIETARQREADFEEQYGKPVDDLIAGLFAGLLDDYPVPGETAPNGAAYDPDAPLRAAQGMT